MRALTAFAERRLEEPYPYLILDARTEKVREAGGVIRSQAVLIAIGLHEGGRREVLAVDIGESRESIELEGLSGPSEGPGLHGVEFVVSDDHAGLKKAITEILTDPAWQRCYVHFLRSALVKKRAGLPPPESR